MAGFKELGRRLFFRHTEPEPPRLIDAVLEERFVIEEKCEELVAFPMGDTAICSFVSHMINLIGGIEADKSYKISTFLHDQTNNAKIVFTTNTAGAVTYPCISIAQADLTEIIYLEGIDRPRRSMLLVEKRNEPWERGRISYVTGNPMSRPIFDLVKLPLHSEGVRKACQKIFEAYQLNKFVAAFEATPNLRK